MSESQAFMSVTFLPTFIEAYRSHHCLWRVKSKDYSNKQKKNAAYKELVDMCKDVVPDCDVKFVKNKIDILRGSFRRESRKLKSSMKSGAGSDNVHVPKLWYYKLLLFLTDQEEVRASSSTMEDVEGTQERENGEGDDESLFEETHVLLIDAFLQNNRLDHVTQVMGFHPKYLDVFTRTQHFILRGDGPLPYDYRHYIAIMAAGRHQCCYLIEQQKQEFIMQGGDKTWLKGLSHIPQKLRNLYDINKILAHRPWLLNKSHIQKLTKGSDNWSLAEVVHAIVLLVHFHCLCSFVFGCGVSEELNHTGEKAPEVAPLHTEASELDSGVGVDTLMQRMKTLSEEPKEFSAEERAKRFERVELQSVELGTSTGPRVKPSLGHFVDDPAFIYEDFARRGEVSTIPTFRVQDYSWDDQGYSLVNRLYNDVGNLLDDKFKTAYNLTYYTMGGRKDVDTSRFRRAIWNYIQCMFGIRHDDYDYGEVNQLLERSLKSFIKSTCCFPERITKADYGRVLREFKHSEKVHVNIMVLEARMQAELLYALRAVMRYMT